MTRRQRLLVSTGIVWVLTYLMLCGFLALGGGDNYFAACLMLFVVMALPTMVIVFIVGLALWIAAGAPKAVAK